MVPGGGAGVEFKAVVTDVLIYCLRTPVLWWLPGGGAGVAFKAVLTEIVLRAFDDENVRLVPCFV